MPGQNTLIIATDYNLIQSKIASVMGTGSGTTGYGQTVASSQVNPSGGSKITVSQWNNLRSDILRARQHQTGTDLTSNLVTATASIKITDAARAAYLAMANDCEIEANRLTAPPPASQASRSNLVPDTIRTTPWNGTLIQTVTVDFGSADAARFFFNAGGQIEFSADRSGGTAGLKNVTWSTMLTNMGTIAFNYTRTTCTGTGNTSTIGFYDLTESYNLIFQKDTPTGTYSPNKYYIYARVPSATNRRLVEFAIHFADESGKPPSFPDPGFGIDENVDGTLISTVQVYRASGPNVNTPVPAASTTPFA
jgi:hypothetical protein